MALGKELTIEQRKEFLFQMKRIRAIEEEIAHRYKEQKMRCPTHLSVGQEAVAAAVGGSLKKEDLAVSTHRAHAHYLGKGGCPKKMIAEIYGKRSGCAKGRGGSMHLIDLDVGFKGSTAIVGNTIPIGVGLGLALKLDKSQNVACVFVGDAAVEEGVFYESVNFAVVKNLPVLFVCENNFYSVYSHLRVRQPSGRKIHKMVEAMGVNVRSGDGNDVEESYLLLQEAVNDIRDQKGPQFVELVTYRWREHCGPNYDNDIGYRTEEEFLEWKEKDPVRRQENRLIEDGLLSLLDVEEMDKRIKHEVSEAFDFAENSPFPNQEEAFTALYKEGRQ